MDQAPRPASTTAGDGAHLQPDDCSDVEGWLIDAEFDRAHSTTRWDEELLLKRACHENCVSP